MNKPVPCPPPSEVSISALSGDGPPMRTEGGGPSSRPWRIKDLVDKKFGSLTVTSLHHLDRRTYWNVLCDCGARAVVRSDNLQSGGTKSCVRCGRERARKARLKDISGQKFGRLTVLRRAKVHQSGRSFWECQCACGKTKTVDLSHLRSGSTSSCGCLSLELTRALNFNPGLTDADRVRRRTRPLVTDADEPGIQTHTILAGLVLRRDNYTCLACGERGVSLAAHHIEPWALNRELRYAPANLVTLCKECHQQFHSLYGNDCDLEDLEDYLKP